MWPSKTNRNERSKPYHINNYNEHKWIKSNRKMICRMYLNNSTKIKVNKKLYLNKKHAHCLKYTSRGTSSQALWKITVITV